MNSIVLFSVVIMVCVSVLDSFKITSHIFKPCKQSHKLERSYPVKSLSQLRAADMIVEGDTATYIGVFIATLIPSLFIVKFVGDQADTSRDKISDKTKEKFKRAMMEQPGQNFAIPTSEEEQIKKQIAKAYMQDKDVDVAVLEEKLRQRAQWRKEMMAQRRMQSSSSAGQDDEEGW